MPYYCQAASGGESETVCCSSDTIATHRAFYQNVVCFGTIGKLSQFIRMFANRSYSQTRIRDIYSKDVSYTDTCSSDTYSSDA